MPDRIHLVGTGRVRTAIEDRLGDRAGALVLAAADGWDRALLDEAEAEATRRSVPFLGVHLELGRAVLGPVVLPGSGCRTCVDLRRRAADPDGAADRAALAETPAGPLAANPFAVDTVAALAVDEARSLVRGGNARTLGAVLTVDLDRLLPAVHPVVADPHCPVCATPVPDEPAELRLVPRPKPVPDVLRVSAIPDGTAIRASYVDSFTGIVPTVFGGDACGLPVSYAPTGWPGRAKLEYGVGRATDRHTSEVAAVLEALERRAGMNPVREPVRARFTDVADHALDPRTLGLPEPDSGFPPFDPDRELGWVWGWSVGRAEPVLVPRSIAYFGHDHSADPPLAYETSNGCALGGCVEEALLHGMLEVAERDAFLLTWYARLAAPRVDVRSARRVEVPLLAARIERAHGYRVLVFDTTADHGVPSVAALAVDREPTPDRPAVMCAAAAHLDPEQACFAALGELALFVSRHVEDYPAQREEAAAMAADPELVRHMDDHALLYGHVSTLPRWDFLLRTEEELSFGDAFAGRPPVTSDLRDDVDEVVARFRGAGMDVVVVDQTGPEQRLHGLSAVKAIVPGALPMTFGHRNRRVRGLPRLARLTAEPNPDPHPFP